MSPIFRTRLLDVSPFLLPAIVVRRGITIIELLVSIGIIALLCAVIVPAVMYARTTSRRMQCQNNLKQHGIAIANYESQYGFFPPGLGMRRALMPYLEITGVEAVFQAAALQPGVIASWEYLADHLQGRSVPVLVCPGDSAPDTMENMAFASYAGNFGTGLIRNGYDGFFTIVPSENPDQWPSATVSAAGVTNGLSNTVSMSEWLHSDGTMARLRVKWNTPRQYVGPTEFEAMVSLCESIPLDPVAYGWRGVNSGRGQPWYFSGTGISLYNHVLPPNRPSCLNLNSPSTGAITAGSEHVGGANSLFGDGHVQFISQEIDLSVWRKLGSRTDRAVGAPLP